MGDLEGSRKKQFLDALEHIQAVRQKAPVRIEDVDYLMDVGSKLLMTFEDMEKSRSKWRERAKSAEAKLRL